MCMIHLTVTYYYCCPAYIIRPRQQSHCCLCKLGHPARDGPLPNVLCFGPVPELSQVSSMRMNYGFLLSRSKRSAFIAPSSALGS